MDVWVTRKRMDGLIEGSAKAYGSRPFSTLSHDQLYDRMPEKLRAKLLGTISGGDDEWSVSLWAVPGIGRRQLIVKRSTLGKVIREAEPWTPPAPPEVVDRRAAALAALRAARGIPLAEPEQASLFG